MLKLLQDRLGRTAIGPSTARGMGPPGTIKAARSFLQTYDLRSVKANTPKTFRKKLDDMTYDLIANLPAEARHWGSARKFVNIFLRNCAYNRFMYDAYGLGRIEAWMEVPLDSHVTAGLKLDGLAAKLDLIPPRWKTVIGLTPELSDRWQTLAQAVAERSRIHRVHLDVRYWNGAHITLHAKQ
ncbi:hypothetical protein [Pandoraea sp.]|uniref:hypothetical protein n=1 Tax=Pandoraea sp. TaxID=1883445 RepID=UPI0035AE8B5F